MIKNYLKLASVVSILFLLQSCDSNPCDDGYTEVEQDGSTVCLPDYVVGIEKSKWLGTTFYHSDFGVIEFENGVWITSYGETLEVSELE